MNANELKILLNIIDDRVIKKMNEAKFLKKYTGRVVKTRDISKSVVKLAGEEVEFVFPNKTGKILKIGDNVHIETIGADLNTGIISEKFGFDNATNTSTIKSEFIKLKEDDTTKKWETFNFINNLNFCWRKVSIDKTPTDGKIEFTEVLPFKFTEEPFVLSQGIKGSDNFSQPLSYSFTPETDGKYKKITGVIYPKDNNTTHYDIDLFIIGRI